MSNDAIQIPLGSSLRKLERYEGEIVDVAGVTLILGSIVLMLAASVAFFTSQRGDGVEQTAFAEVQCMARGFVRDARPSRALAGPTPAVATPSKESQRRSTASPRSSASTATPCTSSTMAHRPGSAWP
jgi:hypothetical protein